MTSQWQPSKSFEAYLPGIFFAQVIMNGQGRLKYLLGLEAVMSSSQFELDGTLPDMTVALRNSSRDRDRKRGGEEGRREGGREEEQG